MCIEEDLSGDVLLCDECRFEYPLTTEYWHIVNDLVRQPCFACMRDDVQLSIVPPRTHYGNIATTIAEQVTLTPGIQQLADQISLAFDGVTGIAEFVRREFHLAKGGSAVRHKYLKMITDLLSEASDRQQKQTNLDLFTNDDLVTLLVAKLEKISQDKVTHDVD